MIYARLHLSRWSPRSPPPPRTSGSAPGRARPTARPRWRSPWAWRCSSWRSSPAALAGWGRCSRPPGRLELRRRRRFLFVASFVAAFLSLGYIAFYLRGGPRAPEAATYWLQGRALSHGKLAWTAQDPTASFRAKNLLLTIARSARRASSRPATRCCSAPAFLLGAPMLIGPLLAAALVPATWLLARELAAGASEDEARAEWIGRIAAVLSLVSAALRYHTAESLPQGAAAAALTVALASALRGRRTGEPRLFAVAGLAFGFLLATQPASAIGVGVALLTMTLTHGDTGRERLRVLAWTCAAALPGLALLLAANRIAVGHAFASPAAYYAARFGPAAPAAVGLKAVLMGALRRVRANLADVANFEPIALLPLLLLQRDVRRRAGFGALVAAGVIVVQVLLAPPAGAGEGASRGRRRARWSTSFRWSTRSSRWPSGSPYRALGSDRWRAATVALAVAGFAMHTSHEHARLAAAGLGRPHYEPDVAREAGATHGLLFFDDDEGYELAHDPGATASHGLEAVRIRGDDHDRLLYDLLGHPPTHRYMSPTTPVAPCRRGPPRGGDTWRFEAEADFPPVATSDPAVRPRRGRRRRRAPARPTGTPWRSCPVGAAEATITIELPDPRGARRRPARRTLDGHAPRPSQRGGPGVRRPRPRHDPRRPAARPVVLDGRDAGAPLRCVDLPGKPVELGGERREPGSSSPRTAARSRSTRPRSEPGEPSRHRRLPVDVPENSVIPIVSAIRCSKRGSGAR